MAEPERALELLKRYGWNATSFQSLEPGFRHWFDPDGDGCVMTLIQEDLPPEAQKSTEEVWHWMFVGLETVL